MHHQLLTEHDVTHHVLTVCKAVRLSKGSQKAGATCYAIYLIHYDQVHLSFAQN